ncbi:unnamed protein product [Cochlearia groenlandica]
MCALVPPLFPNFGWPYVNDDLVNTFLDFPVPDLTVAHRKVSPEIDTNILVVMKKKINHNESERDRRKKINKMFSSLRSCLPATDQSKKLSVSATVTQALKYIPELQEQVKNLINKKQELSGQRDLQNNKQEKDITSNASTISTTKLSETEVMVQISSLQIEKCYFGNVLSGIEEDGLVLVDASSSMSQGERLFYTLYLHMDNNCKMNFDELSDRLLNLYEKCENSFT